MRSYSTYIIFTTLLLLSGMYPFYSRAQQEARISLEKDTILIGDQIRLKLELKLDKKYGKVQFPVVPDTFNHIEVISRGPVDSISNKDFNVFEQQVVITAFEEGIYKIPSWTVAYKDSADHLLSTAFPQIDLYVNTIEIDTTQPFKPIAEIEEEPAPDLMTRITAFAAEHKKPLMALALVLFFVVAAIVAYIFWKKKKKKEPAPMEPPFIKANRLVTELEASRIWEQGHYKEYYSRLSEIIKVYFDEQLSVNATEMTTRDLLLLVKKTNHFRGIHGPLRQILQIADLTKFAKGIPTDTDHIDSVKNAFRIIEYTQPQPTAEDTNNDK